jgi:hypothetical protein
MTSWLSASGVAGDGGAVLVVVVTGSPR